MWCTRETEAKSILTPVSGFLREAGFTHSLSPARNCTYGCSYCYVPTMGIYGGLRAEDVSHWGQWTTFKTNAAERAAGELRSSQVIYCSPLVDPYQPAEAERQLMPDLLRAVLAHPPQAFVVQTRGPLILRDLALLRQLNERTRLRISVSITTNRDKIRRRYEPHCEANGERLQAICALNQAGLTAYATLAPILPCDPEILVAQAIAASQRDLIGDGLHDRRSKPRGATTRGVAERIAAHAGYEEDEKWFDSAFQAQVIEKMRDTAAKLRHRFTTGPAGFGLLTR